MYKLMIVDDEFIIRDGIANTMPWEQIGVEVAGTATGGFDAIEKIPSLHPDIVITDVKMDNMDGLDLTDEITRHYPFIKIIILSGYDEPEYIRKSLELKVSAYLLKPVSPDELLDAVRHAVEEIEKKTG